MFEEPSVLRLDGDGRSPGVARRWARQLLLSLGCPQLLEATELGLTELVTNACLHARTEVLVTASRTAGGVRFAVSDGSAMLPAPVQRAAEATTGRGMVLVAACGLWGVQDRVDDRPAGKTVWFEPFGQIAAPAAEAAGASSTGGRW